MVADSRRIEKDDKKSMSDFMPYSRQSIDDDDIKAVVDVLRSDFITQGPKIKEFENALASYCGSKYAVAFSSGTAALHAAYFSAGIGKDDEIITSPITFVATANAAFYLGARPVFVDVESDTGNINTERIEEAITDKTKAIVPVHFGGHPVYLDLICDIAKRHNLIVIEDACHALGAKYKGKRIGNISDMTVFSFHPVKPITTGEGGSVLTNNEAFYRRLLIFRNHGIERDTPNFENEPHGTWYYEMQLLGFNYRMTDLQSALGTSQLKRLDAFIEKRRKIASLYDTAFSGNRSFDVPREKDYAESSWHLYPIRLKNGAQDSKNHIIESLRKSTIMTQVHYIPVYTHPFYLRKGFTQGLCPVAESFYKSELSIPIYHSMKDSEVSKVIHEVLKCLQ